MKAARFANLFVPIFTAAILFVLCADVALACPGCKQALANADGEQANMVNGYFWSILFMLSMPFTLLGLFAGSMYLAVKRARRQSGASSAHGGSQALASPTA